MADQWHVVEQGDTLWYIAQKYNTTVEELVRINNIPDPDYIVVGQQIKLSGTAVYVEKALATMVTITTIGVQTNTDRTMYACWSWDRGNTEGYEVEWEYLVNNIWFTAGVSTVTAKQSVYSAPSNALGARCRVKPIAKKRDVNGEQTAYWTGKWCSKKTYSFSQNPPTSLSSAPSVTIEDYTLTAELNNIPSTINANTIEFQVLANDSKVFATAKVAIKNNHVKYSCKISAGQSYKVRCRAVFNSTVGPWTDYTNSISTIPQSPAQITVCRASSKTSVYLEWSPATAADSYDIEYATKRSYLEGSNATTTVSSVEFTKYEITGLASGEEYFFHVRAVNGQGKSEWSSISSVIIGKAPSAPTTWSSTTTAMVGDQVYLYWVHNSADGSSQLYGEIEVYVDGVKTTYTKQNTTDEDEKDRTSSYMLPSTVYNAGSVIQWRVRTSGVTREYGEWSVMRSIVVYAPPTVSLTVAHGTSPSLESSYTIESFPICIYAVPGGDGQVPIGYHITITANDPYEGVDNVGNTIIVGVGEHVYSRYIPVHSALALVLRPSDVNLESDVSYTVTCMVVMDSGLTAEAEWTFSVSWVDEVYAPNAEIGIDTDTYSAIIRPYLEDENGDAIPGVTLSVYRRDFDGGFTELITGVVNGTDTFITDPHPALDYARYRVVAIDDTTGAISYADIPGYPVHANASVIQWDEEWRSFDVINEDEMSQPTWAGSMLKLLYNIDISDDYKPDVALIEYIGRKHPVSYYGTHLGATSTWNMAIEKSDTETLYGLRRLAAWKGDVYVREPSGSGYWANVTVSFSQKHREQTIPVTLKVARVEGGV